MLKKYLVVFLIFLSINSIFCMEDPDKGSNNREVQSLKNLALSSARNLSKNRKLSLKALIIKTLKELYWDNNCEDGLCWYNSLPEEAKVALEQDHAAQHRNYILGKIKKNDFSTFDSLSRKTKIELLKNCLYFYEPLLARIDHLSDYKEIAEPIAKIINDTNDLRLLCKFSRLIANTLKKDRAQINILQAGPDSVKLETATIIVDMIKIFFQACHMRIGMLITLNDNDIAPAFAFSSSISDLAQTLINAYESNNIQQFKIIFNQLNDHEQIETATFILTNHVCHYKVFNNTHGMVDYIVKLIKLLISLKPTIHKPVINYCLKEYPKIFEAMDLLTLHNASPSYEDRQLFIRNNKICMLFVIISNYFYYINQYSAELPIDHIISKQSRFTYALELLYKDQIHTLVDHFSEIYHNFNNIKIVLFYISYLFNRLIAEQYNNKGNVKLYCEFLEVVKIVSKETKISKEALKRLKKEFITTIKRYSIANKEIILSLLKLTEF